MEAFRKAIDAGPARPAEKLAPLMPLLWKFGIETVQCSEDDRRGAARIEFVGSADAEMFLNIAQRGYKVEVEQWDEGEDGTRSFRLRLVVFFTIGDLPCLLTSFHARNECGGFEQGRASQ